MIAIKQQQVAKCHPLPITNLIMYTNYYYHYDELFSVLTAKLFNWNFHSPEVVSRSRDPQLQVSENVLDLTKRRSTILKSC